MQKVNSSGYTVPRLGSASTSSFYSLTMHYSKKIQGIFYRKNELQWLHTYTDAFLHQQVQRNAAELCLLNFHEHKRWVHVTFVQAKNYNVNTMYDCVENNEELCHQKHQYTRITQQELIQAFVKCYRQIRAKEQTTFIQREPPPTSQRNCWWNSKHADMRLVVVLVVWMWLVPWLVFAYNI